MVCQVRIVVLACIVYHVMICELFTVESSDVIQSNTVEKSTVTSKWELVDYGDDSDE